MSITTYDDANATANSATEKKPPRINSVRCVGASFDAITRAPNSDPTANPAMALKKAREALRLAANDYGRFALANAALACAKQNPNEKEALLKDARTALAGIPKDSSLRADADALLKEIK